MPVQRCVIHSRVDTVHNECSYGPVLTPRRHPLPSSGTAGLSSSPTLLHLSGQRSPGASNGELLAAWLCDRLAWGVGLTGVQPGQGTTGSSRRKVAHDPSVPWSPSHRLYSLGKGDGSWVFPGTPTEFGWDSPFLSPAPHLPPQGPELSLEDSSSVLNNRVVGLSLGNISVSRLAEPLEITFSHQRPPSVSPQSGPGSY